MISDARECYVYITLPDQTTPVTAGLYRLDRTRQGEKIGRFVYGARYLNRNDAVELDPINLKLTDQVYETAKNNGMFGALRDAGPDFWGRMIIEKRLNRTNLDEVDYLLNSDDDPAGALTFGKEVSPPPVAQTKYRQRTSLIELQEAADRIIDTENVQNSADSMAEALLLAGTSMGGARPKAVIEDDHALWIAKFNRHDDKWNQARVEHAMMTMARKTDMTVAETKVVTVGSRDVLMVKRFDRKKTDTGYQRARMLSAMTVFGAEEAQDAKHKWSYISLAEQMRAVCKRPNVQLEELFRRMCFNALISNTDDHPRNHALLAIDKNWTLSPAYDLTPNALVSLDRRDLAMVCGTYGRYANAVNLLSQAERFMLSADRARTIIDNMKKIVVDSWVDSARNCGVSETDCRTIAGAFAYPGFDYQPENNQGQVIFVAPEPRAVDPANLNRGAEIPIS